ncbi:hypothetical protein HDU67_005842 [Dinochytrium kinnereticum]|nr:hypothetical protein HDU67_005842 [Dinochytrium kinnereticum]
MMSSSSTNRTISASDDRENFLSFASFLSGVRDRNGGAQDPVRQRVLESMISQLVQDADLTSDDRPPPASKFFVKNLPKGPESSIEFPTDNKEYEKKRKAKLGRFANDEDDDPASLMFG